MSKFQPYSYLLESDQMIFLNGYYYWVKDLSSTNLNINNFLRFIHSEIMKER